MNPTQPPDSAAYRRVADRLGWDVAEQRILKQAMLWAKKTHQGTGFFSLEKVLPIDEIIAGCLRWTGLSGIGRRNFLDLRVVRNEVYLESLPAAFEGFRLLHLSDLHCDLEPALIDVVIQRLEGLEYDAVVLTGDYHNKIASKYDLTLVLMTRLISHLNQPCLAVLGNHDFLEKVPVLEEAGLRILLNESWEIERGGQRLWFCGVDDPQYFRTHDLLRARRGVPAGGTAILLCHSPEPYREAERLGYDLMLSGHTHGGQFCLPGGFAILRNADVPRRLLAGAWSQGGLVGYTSRGTGGCGVAARFFCPPEMTLHTLRAARH